MANVTDAPPAPGPPPDVTPWRVALRKFVQQDDGKPLAALLRGAPVADQYKQIPIEVCYDLEGLLDPRSPWSTLTEPKLPPDAMLQTVDGQPRLKASIELERAQESAAVERRRLVEEARKLGEKLGEDAASLMAFARERNDKAALEAFAREREARADWHAARALTYSAVRLSTERLTRTHLDHAARDDQIFVEMFAMVQEGKSASEAAEIVGEKHGLSERTVFTIWKDARESMPAFPHIKKPKRGH